MHGFRVAAILTLGVLHSAAMLGVGVAAAQDRKITWDNAPPPARNLYLAEEEFKDLFPDKKRPNAGYCPVPCSHSSNGMRPDGKPHVDGKWQVNPQTVKTDFEYRQARPGSIGLVKSNPYSCEVTSVYRYAPPPEEQPRPEIVDRPLRRLDMTVVASVNAPHTAQAIREWKERDAKNNGELVRNNKSQFYKYRYVPDLGFGIDRNDMWEVLSTNGKTTQVTIYLNSVRHAQHVKIFLQLEGGAVSQNMAIAIARNSAAIIAKKAFGANAKLERSPVEVGILDVYLASRLGRTPEEDVHENKFKLGDTIYLAVVYRPTEPGMRVRISGYMRPAADALTASEARAPLIRPEQRKWHAPVPLDPRQAYHDFSAWLNPAGQINEDWVDHGVFLHATLSVKPFSSDAQVFYIAMPTCESDCWDKFFLGIGRWDVSLAMDEYRGKDAAFESRWAKDKQEVSTEKIPLFMADNPPVALRYLTELPKK